MTLSYLAGTRSLKTALQSQGEVYRIPPFSRRWDVVEGAHILREVKLKFSRKSSEVTSPLW